MTAEELIAFWSRLGKACIHPDDAACRFPRGIETAALRPVPWLGPLRHARVYVLLLNPGVTADDRRYEAARQDCVQELTETLGGSRSWLFLLDRFQDHPMRDWARLRFGEDIGAAAAASICTLHLVPYHAAKRPPAARLASKLPSALAMRRFVLESLLPEARAGRCGVIVARAASLYGIGPAEAGDGVLVYDPRREARSGRETPATRGGQFLRRFIG